MNKDSYAKNIVLIALAAALLILGKLTVAFIAGVEVVTLFIFVFAAGIGFKKTIAATYIFCVADMLIYPFSIDVAIAYAIYFPFIALIASLINYGKQKNAATNALAAAFCTLLFGVLTTFLNNIFYSTRFLPVYISGIAFFLTYTISNFAIVFILFAPLVRAIKRFGEKS